MDPISLHRCGVYIYEGADKTTVIGGYIENDWPPRRVYIPEPEDYIRPDEHTDATQLAAGMACCAADDEDADTLGEGAGVFIWPAVVLFVAGLAALVWAGWQ